MPANGKSHLQAGTWDRFAASSEPWTTEILSKFAAIDVSPYAGQVGELIAEQQFRPSALCIRHVSDGYNNLALHALRSVPLVFGFGQDHLIREKAEAAGFVFLIVMGALMEYYHQDFLPLILYEKTLDLGIPPKLLVSPHHWKAMTRAFNGVLVNTRFGIIVDEYVRLNPHPAPFVKHKSAVGIRFGTNPASPKSIAKCTQALGDLSKGGTETVTIIGGDDAGLFAAMADWVFGLRTVVRSDSGKELRSNCSGDQKPQVIVIFSQPDKSTSAASRMGSMQLGGITYRLDAEEREKDDKKEDSLGSPHAASPGGRMFWNSLASDFYGSDFTDLLKTSQSDVNIGTIFGCAARVFEGFVKDSQDKDGSNKSSSYFSWRAATPGSYGTGLIETFIAYFPGMSRTRPRMERAQKLSFADAKTEYGKEIARLMAICDCAICHTSAESKPRHERRHCLVVIVESTVTLGLLLAKTIVSPEVYPRRAGMDGFCHYRADVRLEMNKKGAEIAPEDRFEFMYHHALLVLTGGVTLSACLCLFSATLPTIPDANALAYSCDGIVAYSGLLHGTIGYRREYDTSTRIMAGGIQYHGRAYQSVVADAVLMERIEKGEMVADADTEYEIVEPQDPGQALVLRLKA
jgi:hypothetical protein